MINEDATHIIASAYNAKRWPKYKGAVTWELHSVYMKHEIYRSCWKATGKHTSMYASMDGDSLLLGESLDNIRDVVKQVVKG